MYQCHTYLHILDLIITRSTNDLILGPINATLPLSDHFFVECFIRFPSPSISSKSVSYRKLKSIDIDAFKSDITSSVLCSNTHWNDLGNLSKLYVSTLSEILDRHALLKRKTLVTRVKIPWFNADVLQLKRFRRKAERKALKSGLSSDWLAYQKICNRHSALLKSTRTSYYTNLIDQCAGDSRKLFKLVTFFCKIPVTVIYHRTMIQLYLRINLGNSLLKKLNLSRTPSVMFKLILLVLTLLLQL